MRCTAATLLRAVQTATPIAQRHGMTVLAVPGLRERAYGCLEGQPSEAAVELAGDIAWTDPDVHPGGGESLREVYRRVASTVAHLARSHQDEAVGLVSHGDTIRVLLAWVDGLGPDEIPWREVANGSITVVRLRTQSRSLIARRATSPAASRRPAPARVGLGRKTAAGLT